MGLFFCIIVPESFYLAFIYPRYSKIYQKAKKIDERKKAERRHALKTFVTP